MICYMIYDEYIMVLEEVKLRFYFLSFVLHFKIRPLFPWRHYFHNTHRLIFGVDRNDYDHVVEVRDKLHTVLNEVILICFWVLIKKDIY